MTKCSSVVVATVVLASPPQVQSQNSIETFVWEKIRERRESLPGQSREFF